MAVTLSLFAGAGAQFFDNNGNVLSGGKIYTYFAGTTTPLAAYTTNSESAFHTNPIILDAAGRVPSGGEIWLQLGIGYKFVLRTSTDVLIATYDNIPSSAQPPAANDADSIMYEQGYTVTAGSFVVGKIYRIASVGTTNFTLIGAVNNTVGTHFIATGVGTGTGTAELSQTVETKLRETVSVKDFGATGNGVTDDTAAIQAALNVAGNIYIPEGTYIVAPLQVLDDTSITFSPKATLLAKSGAYIWSDSLLNINDKENVTIFGNGATIQMRKSEYPLQEVINGVLQNSEYRHCIRIYFSTNIRIYDLICKDPGGDCFVVGGGSGETNRNISLYNCIADNASRNGLSVSNAINCLVMGGEYKNSNRFPPQFGIDIEPNPGAGYEIQNINIIGVYTNNNAGGGISVVPPNADNAVSVNISDWTSFYDGNSGAFLASSGGISSTSKMQGAVNINDCTIINPQGMGVHVQLWDQYAPQLNVKNIQVVNPGSNLVTAAVSVLRRTGVLINREVSQVVTSIGGIFIKDVAVRDDRTTPNTFTPYYLRNNGVTPFKDIQIINPSGNVWTNSNIQPTLVTGVIENVSIKYDNGFLVNNQSSQTLAKHSIGTTIAAASNSNFTLPLAQDVIGAEFSFLVNNPGLVYIIPQGSDVIEGYSSGPAPRSDIISRTVGARITLKAVAVDRWQVLNSTSGWGTRNYYGTRYPMTYFTESPELSGLGSWERGDIIWNLNASAGGYIGWVCTTSGSPGTWKQFGLINV